MATGAQNSGWTFPVCGEHTSLHSSLFPVSPSLRDGKSQNGESSDSFLARSAQLSCKEGLDVCSGDGVVDISNQIWKIPLMFGIQLILTNLHPPKSHY